MAKIGVSGEDSVGEGEGVILPKRRVDVNRAARRMRLRAAFTRELRLDPTGTARAPERGRSAKSHGIGS